jgi:hypothetical protein
MSALEKAAAEMAFVQEHLERAVARCVVATRHADDAHHAATTLGAAGAVADTEDVKAALTALQQLLDRVTTTAEVTAGTVRAVIHGPAAPTLTTERPEIPAPVPGTP